MSIKSVHPLYSAMQTIWELNRDSYLGEEAIKGKGTVYLPATPGQIEDGQGKQGTIGQKVYDGYKDRAVYPDIFKDAVEAAIGIMHKEPPTITLPTALEEMRENATLLNESLELLLRKINARQLISGRLGLLGDIRVDRGTARPVVVLYNELAIRNWDDTSVDDEDVDVRMVVLDESGYEMDPATFEWKQQNKYRVLALTQNDEVARNGVYSTVVLTETAEIGSTPFTQPSVQGATLDEIPFVFVNSKDLSGEPDMPPLNGLARLCLAIYRGEADYRQHLFEQSQDTLVRIGAQATAGDEEEDVRIGAGSRIDVPIGGDAKFIGVSSQGLPEQRQALENDYARAHRKGGQLLDTTSRSKESGDALKIRVAAQTATLPQIAQAGAAALEKVLKSLAKWYGANPEEVSVVPNLNYADADLNGQTVVQIVQAKGLGAPISEQSIHNYLQEQGFTKMSYEEEIELIGSEEPALGTNIPSPADQNQDVDEDDDNADE